ncbi:nucleoid-associated protein [Candidatus Thioglobus sp.]|uniref:nucleoid-associated protein n=1 Tax=Candidatus Thioglobus sp. TaxID=2026721 RepID=UPI003D09A78B
MELKNITLHKIIRENNENPILDLSDHLLDINDITNDFIEKLIKSYTSKSPTYGAFDEDIINNPFQTNVKKYFTDDEFLNFSQQAMETLKKTMGVTPQAKGGYVIFAHYIEKLQDFIVVAMLDNSARFVVNKKLDIEKLLGLDIDKVARANRVNWQDWQEGRDSYLSFIKGTRGVSNYFAKNFIGCTDFTTSKQNAKNLELAVSSYIRDNNFKNDRKISIKKNIKEYTNRQIDNEEDIRIDAISAYVNVDNPEDFTRYVHNNDHKVGNFRSTRPSDFKNFEIKTLKGDGYKLEYELVSDNIDFDKGRKIIIIKNVPSYIFED